MLQLYLAIKKYFNLITAKNIYGGNFMSTTILFFSGTVVGIINSLFGAGGGILAVPLLRKSGLAQRKAQASSLAVILPLSAVSALIYLMKGYFTLGEGLPFIPFGLLGGFIGTKLITKIPEKILGTVFYLLLIYSGIRMIMR